MKVRITENKAPGKVSQEVVDGVAQTVVVMSRRWPSFRVVVDDVLLMPRASRGAVKALLDTIDLRNDIEFDGEAIASYEDVDLWFGLRRGPKT